MTNLKHLQRRWTGVEPLDVSCAEAIRAHLDNLTKPRGSLGRLEDLAVWFGTARGETQPSLPRKVVAVFAADHGVAAEGVSAYPQEVTAQMVYNFLRGGAGINVLARHVGAEVVVVDVGVAHDFPELECLRRCKVRPGTRNMLVDPAMTRQEALAALRAGMDVVDGLADQGLELLGTGDMGIANTTASSAITALITGEPVDKVTGRGTGVDDAAMARKQAVLEKVLVRHRPEPSDPLDVLSKVGGLEIAGMAGAILAAAQRRIPVVLDGFISGAAALIAVSLQPQVRDYLLASHRSAEPGHQAALGWLRLEPVLDLGLRLGEGTGGVLAMGLVDAAVKVLNEMATFGEAGVSDGDESGE